MKRLIYIYALITFLSSFAYTQTVQLDWAMNVGNDEEDEVKAVVHDNFGNAYLLGDFKGTVDFDHGPNTVNITSTPFRVRRLVQRTCIWLNSTLMETLSG